MDRWDERAEWKEEKLKRSSSNKITFTVYKGNIISRKRISDTVRALWEKWKWNVSAQCREGKIGGESGYGGRCGACAQQWQWRQLCRRSCGLIHIKI
jgi:hypothetical protein